MRVCELIEWLKRENPLSIVEIELIDEEYPDITTFCVGIECVEYLGEHLDKVRIKGRDYRTKKEVKNA